jgi:hypothetical protein
MPCEVIVPTCLIGVAVGLFKTIFEDAALDAPPFTLMIISLFSTSCARDTQNEENKSKKR